MRIENETMIIEHDNLDYEIIARNYPKWHELCINAMMFEDDLQLRFVRFGPVINWTTFYNEIMGRVETYHDKFNSRGKLIQIGDRDDDSVIDIYLERTVSDVKQAWHKMVNIHIATGHGLGIEIVRLSKEDLIKLGKGLLSYADQII